MLKHSFTFPLTCLSQRHMTQHIPTLLGDCQTVSKESLLNLEGQNSEHFVF